MSTPDQPVIPWWDDVVEDYVDGTLPDEDMSRLDAFQTVDAALASQIRMARTMRDTFRSMSDVACPERDGRSPSGSAAQRREDNPGNHGGPLQATASTGHLHVGASGDRTVVIANSRSTGRA